MLLFAYYFHETMTLAVEVIDQIILIEASICSYYNPLARG